MNILVISGSRNLEGQTAQAAGTLLEGASAVGIEGEMIFLPQLIIERCRQCDDDGWGVCSKEGRCIIDDDFASIFQKIKEADAVVVATPVYFGDLSESLRAFTDRLRRICFKGGGSKEIGDKPAIGICVAGGRGFGASECCFHLDKVLRICGFNLIDMIPARRQNLDTKLPHLRLIGKGLVTK